MWSGRSAISCGLSLFAMVAIGGVLVITDHSHHIQSKNIIGHSGGLDRCGGHCNQQNWLLSLSHNTKMLKQLA